MENINVPNVTKEDIKKALRECGLREGDTVNVHSSLKACGHIEGGADTVIDAFLEVIGKEGTLVMPTLAQKNFETAYEDWTMDRPSDTGLITETFRLRPESIRSDQATHSVAAQGPLAEWLTRDHGKYGKRPGVFGDTCFAVCSPWQKLYDMNAKIVLFGVTMHSNTMKHLIEYVFINDMLSKMADPEIREQFANRLRAMDRMNTMCWPFSSGELTQEWCDKAGLLQKVKCGNAELVCYRAKDTNDYSEKVYFEHPELFWNEEFLPWFKEAKQYVGLI